MTLWKCCRARFSAALALIWAGKHGEWVFALTFLSQQNTSFEGRRSLLRCSPSQHQPSLPVAGCWQCLFCMPGPRAAQQQWEPPGLLRIRDTPAQGSVNNPGRAWFLHLDAAQLG